MFTENQIIEGCKQKKKEAQKALYQAYSGAMRGLCMRYSHSSTEAEDILHEGFIKIFLNIKQYTGTGSFSGWIKRIMINTAITSIKNTKKYSQNVEDLELADENQDDWVGEGDDAKTVINGADFSQADILLVIKDLPDGYRMVFNLYAMEGYKHKEIAELLQIDINTSKTQLLRARKWIQKRLLELVKNKKKSGINTVISCEL